MCLLEVSPEELKELDDEIDELIGIVFLRGGSSAVGNNRTWKLCERNQVHG